MSRSKFIRMGGAAMLAALGLLAAWTSASGLTFQITSVAVRDGQLVLAAPSEAGQTYALQAAEEATGPWQELTRQPGTGEPLEFSDPLSLSQRFYRLLATAADTLDLAPAEPLLDSGAVSLPDAVAGSPYEEGIQPHSAGTGDLTLELEGELPAGISSVISGNGTPEALLRLTGDGAGMVAGERHEFSVSVTDEHDQTASRSYNLRVIAPPPVIQAELITLKAGEPASAALEAAHGAGVLAWSAPSETLPPGVSLDENGRLSGTPTAAAAEANEDGQFVVPVQVSDNHTDRVTGAPAPRTATESVTLRVRLSYQLNLLASRPGGPGLMGRCAACHGSFFPPNIPAGASALIGVGSQPFGFCSSQVYVEPGRANDSLLFRKLSAPDCGDRMPQGGPFLDQTQLGRLERWIQELTPDDTD